MNIISRYSTEEIAKVLCNIAMDNPSEEIISECDEAIYWLKGMAQNQYNDEYFRTLFRVLEILTYEHDDVISKSDEWDDL